jgi:hypothetical protein
MKRITLVSLIFWLTTAAHGAESKWLAREFSKGWNLPGHGVEEFLNDECWPSRLDGIQLFAIQNGHGSTYNLHVYCRQDGNGAPMYRATE